MAFDLPQPVAHIQHMNPPPALVAGYAQGPSPFDVFLCEISDGHGAMRAQIRDAKAKVEEFAAMPENWDGYGALQISPETKKNAQAALDVILLYASSPDITPNPNGTVSFEWETAKGISHLEIGRTKFSFYIKLSSGVPPLLADGNVDQITADFGKLVASWLFPTQHGVKTMTTITSNPFNVSRV